jgi:hypothetical protein
MVLTNTLSVVRLFVFEVFLFIVCVLGDYFISNTNSILGLGTQLSRVLIDSFTHGFVGKQTNKKSNVDIGCYESIVNLI